ncbi:MAG TPA: hypothetical protein VMT62_10120 [Syntrophorhabdaceae bacterium]|nr:hypothetical protein [Syntrophorhabdaceae bacterium]
MDSVNKAIADIKSQLQWPVECKISDLENQAPSWSLSYTHRISYPKNTCLLDILHEHLHALDRERLPAQYSDGIPPIDNCPWGFEVRVNYYFNVVRDWTVNFRIATLCPDSAREWIEQDYHDKLNIIQQARTPEDKLIVGLAFAEYAKFLGKSDIPTIEDKDIQRVFEVIIDVPTEPNLDELHIAVDALASIFDEFRVQKCIGTKEIWYVIPNLSPACVQPKK